LARRLHYAGAGKDMSDIIQNTIFAKSGVPMLEKFLELSAVKHKLVSGNLANVSTPGYKSKDIDFHGELKKAIGQKSGLKMATTHPNHMQPGQVSGDGPKIITDNSSESNGINNVNVDKEMADLAQNQITYALGARMLSLKFQGLKKAIKGQG
jgi:flagellar basal-body rod protein FlgB